MTNVDNWEPDLQRLAAEYSPGLVLTAFAVREELSQEGYPGIHYMRDTDSYLNSQTMNVKNKVEKQMNRELREKGLK